MTTQRALPPATRSDDLRDHLPAIEPDRTVSDWGRSERLEGLVDQTLVSFLYHYWFRCEVEGIENVPASGGALLVSNHGGALSPDAAMIAKALREEHVRARALHIAVDDSVMAHPGFSMLLAKLGCVTAHPANIHRLLYDERSLVLVRPEGRRGTRKLFKDRYRLGRFEGTGFVDSAAAAEAPIVPVCVVGSEEAAPIFARVRTLERLAGRLPVPLADRVAHVGPLGLVPYLPAKFRIRFLEPVAVDAGAQDRAAVEGAAEAIRATIQENLLEMVGARDSVWTG